MTTDKIQDINDRRLKCWGERLTNAHCTAGILIGVSELRSGEIYVCLPHGLPLDVSHRYLAQALKELDAGDATAGVAAPGAPPSTNSHRSTKR